MTFTQLLTALSEKLGLELVDEGGATALEIDGITVVLQDADEDLVLIHADLGEIPVDRRESLTRAALEANYLYQGTGGATLSINLTNGHLHLQRYNWLARIETEKAVDVLERFAETAVQWQSVLSAPLTDPAASNESSQTLDPTDLSLSSGYLRM